MRGSGPSSAHTTKVSRGNDKHGKNKISRNDIGESLYRRARALGFADHAYDLSQQSFAADAFSLHDDTAGAVDRAAGDLAAFRFFNGNRFAGDHRFIDRSRALEDDAIDWNFFAGPNAQTIADLNPIHRYVFFFAIVVYQSSGLRRQSKKSFNGAAGLAARAELEDLPEQYECCDDRRRFEVNRNGAAVPIE